MDTKDSKQILEEIPNIPDKNRARCSCISSQNKNTQEKILQENEDRKAMGRTMDYNILYFEFQKSVAVTPDVGNRMEKGLKKI